ncbi:MAG: phosphoribosylpyrophosphate synthetase [Leeuwenhoekiella sp.]|nr:phosphoribosylpyrophosphate synthetase [Leeuwenhoekiella sp.]MBH13029.1 phosphoribosylpyrophosphate synthetase [Leeuwenhoekiella sp.]|tara:strand:+ start:17449 stop:17742 length:294 start_codon:yes stop_codon:yes gene_type:complete
MKTFDILSQTMIHLQEQGYTYDFNLCSGHIECNALKLKLHPEDFDVDEMHRYEGMSSTDDNSVLYAISSKNGIKGLLVDAYGVYAENISEAMRKKLR